MLTQRTIKTLCHAEGMGLHSGQRVELTLRPAPPNTGIIFRRVDLQPVIEIAAQATTVGDTRMASSLCTEHGVRVQTVEHLMSACAGLAIDNLYIEVTAEEMPIMDGSAASFVFLLQSAGLVQQQAAKKLLRVKRSVEVRQGLGLDLKWAKLSPYDGYRLSFEIDFSHPAVNSTGQRVMFDMNTQNYAREIARARTFGFTKDFEMMRKNGLAMGGGLDNAIVLNDRKIINSGGLRYGDEFAKHKILDAMGDLYLVGKPLMAEYTAFRSGHGLNNLLLRELLNTPDAYEIVTFDNLSQAPRAYSNPPTFW